MGMELMNGMPMGMENENGTDLKHGKYFLGRGRKSSKPTLERAEVHESAQLPPIVVLIEQNGQRYSDSEVQ